MSTFSLVIALLTALLGGPTTASSSLDCKKSVHITTDTFKKNGVTYEITIKRPYKCK